MFVSVLFTVSLTSISWTRSHFSTQPEILQEDGLHLLGISCVHFGTLFTEAVQAFRCLASIKHTPSSTSVIPDYMPPDNLEPNLKCNNLKIKSQIRLNTLRLKIKLKY